MAITAKSARGTLGTGSATLWTAGASGGIVTNIVICNSNAATVTATLTLNAVAIVSGASIPANSTVTFDLKQHLSNAQVVAGFASTTGVTYHISGVDL